MNTPSTTPDCIRAAVEGYQWTPTTEGESGGSVYKLHRPDRPALYLKSGNGKVAHDITDEMVRLLWLAKFLPVPQIQQFCYEANGAWLLTTAVAGRSAYECLVSNPRTRTETVRSLAEFLARFHALPVLACPFNSDYQLRMVDARHAIESAQLDESDFSPAHAGWTAEQVWQHMQALLPLAFDRVVTHGDFSLGNLLLQEGKVTGCIDVGRLGTADPYQDLAILWENLGEFGADLQAAFFEAYGIAHPDERKIQFHLCLDEFF